MIHSLARGLCLFFKFQIFPKCWSGLKRSWRRSSQILYHKLELSEVREPWAMLGDNWGTPGNTASLMIKSGSVWYKYLVPNCLLYLWSQSHSFITLHCLQLTLCSDLVDFLQSKIFYLCLSCKEWGSYHKLPGLWSNEQKAKLSSYSNGALDHDSDVILMFPVRSFFHWSP